MTEFRFRVPFVRDVPHKEGMVEGDGVFREVLRVVEERRFNFLDFERGCLPV